MADDIRRDEVVKSVRLTAVPEQAGSADYYRIAAAADLPFENCSLYGYLRLRACVEKSRLDGNSIWPISTLWAAVTRSYFSINRKDYFDDQCNE